MDNMTESEASVIEGDINSTVVTRLPRGSESIQIFRKVMELGCALPLAILGIVVNLIALVVLGRQKRRQTTTLVLQALALADTLVLINTILLRSSRYVFGVPWQEHVVYHYLYRWLYPATFHFRLLNTWLTVLLTIDRFIAVCRPLRAIRLCTISKTYLSIALIVLLSFLFSLPQYFTTTLVEAPSLTTNKSRLYFRFTPLNNNYLYIYLYRITANFIVLYVVPMILLVGLNSALLIALRHANRQRAALQHTPHQQSSNRSVTVIVVTIVLVCTVCNAVAMISHILFSLSQISDDLKTRVDIYRRYISLVSNVLVTLNSTINFFIYCLCSRNFRSALSSTCRCEQALEQPTSHKPESLEMMKRGNSLTTSTTASTQSFRLSRGSSQRDALLAHQDRMGNGAKSGENKLNRIAEQM